jgi:hypothetical protein
VTFAVDQPEYIPLPALVSHEGCVLTRWTLTPEERARIAAGEDVFVQVLAFGQRLQPIALDIGPFDFETMVVSIGG